jgi:hypothetical protein
MLFYVDIYWEGYLKEGILIFLIDIISKFLFKNIKYT